MLSLIHEILGPIATLGSPPPPLPAPPVIERWLFERSILLGLALAAFALASFVVLNRRGDAQRGAILGGVLAFAAIATAVTGIAVETTRERLLGLSSEFVDAVAAGETGAASELLADDLVIAVGGTTLPGGGVLARRALEAFRKEVRVTQHVVSDGSGVASETAGASQFLVRATTDAGPGSAWFRLSWRRGSSGEWRIHLIEVLRVNGQTPEGSGTAALLSR